MFHCLRAGKPALVFPVDYDQFDHAARLVAAGVARRVRRLVELPELIARTLDDPAMLEPVARLQAALARPTRRLRAHRSHGLRPAVALKPGVGASGLAVGRDHGSQ